MKPNLKYVEIDGRGDDTNLLERILSVVGNLKKGEGLHLIKDFEPLPLYQMMKSKGYDKMVEKISDNEYHVWFFPIFQYLDMEMGKHLSVDNERVAKMLEIKEKVFRKELSPSEARELVNRTFTSVTPEEFAFGSSKCLTRASPMKLWWRGWMTFSTCSRMCLLPTILIFLKGIPSIPIPRRPMP